MNYQFTQNWFAQAIPAWEILRSELPSKKHFLEVGSYEGRSMVWTVENLMEDGGSLICIDTWEGSQEHQGEDMAAVEERFDHNKCIAAIKFPDRKVQKIKMPSAQALRAWMPEMDMVYIDGSHHGLDVITDACMAWPYLKVGGFMVFDDYNWNPDWPAAQTPKLAIDTFLTLVEDCSSVFLKSYQVIIKKEKR